MTATTTTIATIVMPEVRWTGATGPAGCWYGAWNPPVGG
jgi:hypothetical protein